jgi:membrane protein YqaA with SNARE-associated domain
MGVMALALLWGFAEATLFVVVPEVLISWVAIDRLRRALYACILALVGAMAGGGLMYGWGANDLDRSLSIVERVPAISVEMLQEIDQSLLEHGSVVMIPGAFIGRPYKAYAVQAPRADIDLLPFLAATIPARLVRFVLAALLTYGIARRFGHWSLAKKRIVLSAFWITFYAVFWSLMPN